MDLAKRDIKLDILKQVLEERNKFLMDKNNAIKQASKENTYLVEVADDYARYYKSIKKEKSEQQRALELLSNYISETSKTIDQTNDSLEQSKIQQQKIVEHIERLRKEIDAII
jgi:methyl-accepting chemotaxis protein